MDRYVVMGVSGCGKSSIGAAFAKAIGGTFVDGDDLHPQANIQKMERGEPLNDADRKPWLREVARALNAGEPPIVVGCSALRRLYRDWIRSGVDSPVMFLHLAGEKSVIAQRMAAREGHFMPLSLLDSQFATLEPPGKDELCVTADLAGTPEEILQTFLAHRTP